MCIINGMPFRAPRCIYACIWKPRKNSRLQNMLHTEDVHIIVATVLNLVAQATWFAGSFHFCRTHFPVLTPH